MFVSRNLNLMDTHLLLPPSKKKKRKKEINRKETQCLVILFSEFCFISHIVSALNVIHVCVVEIPKFSWSLQRSLQFLIAFPSNYKEKMIPLIKKQWAEEMSDLLERGVSKVIDRSWTQVSCERSTEFYILSFFSRSIENLGCLFH